MDTDKDGKAIPSLLDDRGNLKRGITIAVSLNWVIRAEPLALTSPKVVLSILPLTIRAATSLLG